MQSSAFRFEERVLDARNLTGAIPSVGIGIDQVFFIIRRTLVDMYFGRSPRGPDVGDDLGDEFYGPVSSGKIANEPMIAHHSPTWPLS